MKAADRGDLPTLLVSDAVLTETMNGLHRDVGHDKAAEMLDRLELGRNFEIVREPNAAWVRGREIFRNHPRLSMSDALQVASARHRGVEYIFSFDGGFDGPDDLTRLASVVDPYAP